MNRRATNRHYFRRSPNNRRLEVLLYRLLAEERLDRYYFGAGGVPARSLTKVAHRDGQAVRRSVRSNEARLRLRAEIRKRVERIDLAFNAEILSAPDPNRTIANVTPGKGNVVAQVRFVNGVTKWAIFDAKREKAVLLS